MEKLSQKDWHLLVGAIEKLNSDFDPRSLPQRAVSAVAGLVSGDYTSFDFFTRNENYNSTPWNDGDDSFSPDKMEIFAQFVHQHPLIPFSLANPQAGALKITDVIPQSELERTELYNEFYRLVRVRYQMGISLPVAPDLTICCVVSRGDNDLSERDKTVLNLIAPHLLNAIRNALAYERISVALETTASGVIALDSSGRLAFMSEFARGLCERYFGGEKLEDNSLPETLDRWIRQSDEDDNLEKSPKSLRIENQHGVLQVCLMNNSSSREKNILLEEKSAKSPKMFEHLPLSPRETEILFWITQGKTDAVIALLCGISPRTVQKHAENIYTKLGVETRTAVMLRALEIL